MPAPAASPLGLHVTLRWRADPLAFRLLERDGVARVGAHPDALAPIPCSPALGPDFVFARVCAGVPLAFAPSESVATVWRAAGAVELVEGPAAVALAAGDEAEIVLGDFRLSARAEAPEPLPQGRRRRLSGAWGGLAAAALAHALVLGLAAQDALARTADDREEERTQTLTGLLAEAELRESATQAPVEDAMGGGEGRLANDEHGDGRKGGGAAARGEEGSMGDRMGRPGVAGHYAVPERLEKDPALSASRAEALADASAFGMIGLLAQGPAVPHADFADLEAHGADPIAADGAMWARTLGQEGGAGGLGLHGIGEGGGGSGEGIGLGRVGTLGHTDGDAGPGTGGEGSALSLRGWSGGGWSGGIGIGIGRTGTLGRRTQVSGPRICMCGEWVSGRLPPEAIQRIVRQNFGRFRACYEDGLRRDPALQGRVSARFVIGRDGAVSSVSDGGSDLPDRGVVSCVVRAFYGVSFPQPEGGIVTVTYPILFSPG
jgi:hypothetical protein